MYHLLSLGDTVTHVNCDKTFHLRGWVGTIGWLDASGTLADVQWDAIPRRSDESDAAYRDRLPFYPRRYPTQLLRRQGFIRVVNKHHYQGKALPPNFILAMQTAGHPLGNPWYKDAQTDRPGCLATYKRWLWANYKDITPQRECIHALADTVLAGEDLHLACVCAPLGCHCDSIKALLEKIVVPARRYAA